MDNVMTVTGVPVVKWKIKMSFQEKVDWQMERSDRWEKLVRKA